MTLATKNTLKIREATEDDFDQMWPILMEIIRRGETYTYDPNMTKEEALHVWVKYPRVTWLVEEDGTVLGTYYLKTNANGPGSHVCNCGYMVGDQARGKGVATFMCKHSKKLAVQLGYKAMQYNFVASTNGGAVRLWEKLGFDIVGTLKKAFHHPAKGYVDAFVMYQWLADE